jgi:hypothetical protein
MLCTTPASAQEVFTYTGKPFLYIGGCCGVSKVSGSFSVASTLAANTTYNLSGTVASYSFTDGRTTWTPANYPGSAVAPFNLTNEIVVTTGATGNIASWQINLVSNNPDAQITTQSMDYAGVGGVLDATNVYNNYNAYSFAPGNPNGEQGVPGIWSVTSVPEPGSWLMLFAGLGLVGRLGRGRNQA